MTLGALHYAVMTNEDLVAQGVPAEVATAERERHTGHIRRVQPRWARAIGWWGGVATLIEIAEHVDVEIETAKAYAKFRGLRWRTKRRSFTHAQLSVLALATPGTAVEAGLKLGLLPVEVCVRRSAATEVIVQSETTLAALLAWPPDVLEQAWRRLDLRIEAPRSERLDLRAPGYLERIVAEAERMIREDEAET
jgi:hypothetical protein